MAHFAHIEFKHVMYVDNRVGTKTDDGDHSITRSKPYYGQFPLHDGFMVWNIFV